MAGLPLEKIDSTWHGSCFAYFFHVNPIAPPTLQTARFHLRIFEEHDWDATAEIFAYDLTKETR